MLYPITFLLWAIFHSSLSIHPVQQHQHPRSCAPGTMERPPADSTVFRELQDALKARQRAQGPEKLYLQLDRTLLKPGETVWFNAFLLNAGDLLPSLQSQMLQVDLLDVRGSVLQSKKHLALNGIAAGEFDFPDYLPGGLYKIRAYTRWMQNFNDVFERDITLQKVVLPKLNLKLEFEKKGIGAGEVAIARFDAQGLDNQYLSHTAIQFTATADGQTFATGEAQTDANGRAYVRFQLPEHLESADGLLNIQIAHQGQTEAISRPIPIVLNKIDLQFFPEGGDAVAGLPCRMAFKAVNEFGKPADVAGAIYTDRGVQVASFSSYHDGMGAFDFVPAPGTVYEARLTKPSAAIKPVTLPLALTDGQTMRLQEKTSDGLSFDLASTTQGTVFLVGQSRDKLFFFKEIMLKPGAEKTITIPTRQLPIGIARFTLFDQNKTALAERLAFVNRDHGLKIDITPDKQQYLPREHVRLKIQVNDHAGHPVSGRFSLAVTDESLLTYADDKQGHLLSSLLLEQDVKGHIEEPNFYFDGAEPKSEQALDYLLMTQGWRRFEWKAVLANDPNTVLFPAEKAIVSGIVLRTDGKPSVGGKVQLYPYGPSVMTDQNGCFSFSNINADQYSALKYVGREYYPIQGYGDYVLQRRDKTIQPANVVRYVASANGATLATGKVMDDGDPLVGATIRFTQNGKLVRGMITNLDGLYSQQLAPGVYDVEVSYTGFQRRKFSHIQIKQGMENILEPVFMANHAMAETVITESLKKGKHDKGMGAPIITGEQIRNLPTKNLNAIVPAEIAAKEAPAAPENKAMAEVDMKAAAPDRSSAALSEVMVVAYKVPLVRQDDMSDGQVFSSDQLMPRSKASRGRGEAYTRSSGPYFPWHPPTFSRARQFYIPYYGSQPGPVQRTDFRPTIYWNPNIQTNALGSATVEFVTSDAITNFRATLEGLSNAGQPGRCISRFFVQKPVDIAVKLPPSVITGDVLNLQVVVSNHTQFPAGGQLSLNVPAHFTPLGDWMSKGALQVSLDPGAAKTITASYKIGVQTTGNENVSIKLLADEAELDAFSTTIRTLNPGYPVYQIASGLSARTAFNISLVQPMEGSVSATLNAYPNALYDLLKGMERMLQQPSGCFEQVSSSNYPNLLVLDLLHQTGDQRPEVETKAMTLLEDGYKKLTAYECKSGGFDWWGRDPGHEGLTAYGILEFTDMAKVFPVDKTLIERTVNWIKSRRDGKGGWTLNPNSLHGWQNDPVLDCYIVWALAEAGYGAEFTAEIAHAQQQAVKSKDPYQLALLANALLAMGDQQGIGLVQSLLEKQDENGSWTGKTHSVMYAYGDCFRIETTALAALALMKSGKHAGEAQKAIKFLMGAKTEYGYGSTQSTVLALKAIIEFVKQNKTAAKDGQFVVSVDGQNIGEYTFSAQSIQKLVVPKLEQYFKNDHPRIEVVFAGEDQTIPFDLEVKYASRLPKNTPDCPLALTTALDKTQTAVGETVRLTAVLQNTTDQVQASPMIVLGIPSGLGLQPWQLKKLVDEKKCDFYELWDGYAVFHFEQLAPGASRTLALDLRAEVAGQFEAPASQAFLYYSNDQRVWSKPERLEIR